MANRAYVSIWCRDFPESLLLERWGTFLSTVPFSAPKPGFTEFVIRALSAAESPIREQDLRATPLSAAELIELGRDHVHADCAYETSAYWDLWSLAPHVARWQLVPQPLQLSCYGEDYDGDTWKDMGHFHADIGFEHFFTGHARLLGLHNQPVAAPQHPEEEAFLSMMAKPENLRTYQERTRENIRKLFHWMQQVETVLPLQRSRFWSEGEENFEARMEEILAMR
jgi:hypothetical protein